VENKIHKMKELVQLLQEASKAYYQENREIMSNYEYDKLYDELLELEKETGVTLSGSPTITVGHELLSELPKEAHESQMLSLDKTKSVEALADWLGDQKGLLSWKLDGLTIVLTYQNGKLAKAVTRGNGEIGEVITNNAMVFKNIPLEISYKRELILRGEAIIRYSEFEKINQKIENIDARYKNPRNLCSGSVRQLNNQVTAERNVEFYAFSLVKAEQVDFHNSRERQFSWLKQIGFDIVDYQVVDQETIPKAIEDFSAAAARNDLPSDGLVLLFDDIAYGESLGKTSKFPRDSIAFKWADETAETRLRYIEWSPSRTGLINPVAVFEPVELEGSTVSRASVHNVSILEELALGDGDLITVYKANMIIPQIAENLTRSGVSHIPKTCPVCGGLTEIKQVNDVKSLYCINEKCQVKKLKSFSLLVSRDALNISGLSEATLDKFIQLGFIKEYADLFHLESFKEDIIVLEGFGEKSYHNLVESIKKSSHTTLPRVIYGLGIANIGLSNAKALCRHFHYDYEKMKAVGVDELTAIEGIGEVIANAFVEFWRDEVNHRMADHLMENLTIERDQPAAEEQKLEGKTFVITGSLIKFSNRKELQELIEAKGGKVTAAVTSKTSYLINNDVSSNSAKNKKAREFQIPVISEEDFMELVMDN